MYTLHRYTPAGWIIVGTYPSLRTAWDDHLRMDEVTMPNGNRHILH